MEALDEDSKCCLDVFFPDLPPSENKIRVHRWQGGATYSAEAKLYRRKFIEHMRNNYMVDLVRFTKAHTETSAYILEMDFYFPTLVNKGWPKKAKTFFKKFDVGNRRKLLEDCLSELIGIDDSLFLRLILSKNMGKDTGVYLRLTPANIKEYGVRHEK